MGFTVYTTASTKNHEYLKKPGADVVFDYKASDFVSQIIDTVKKDGVTLRTAICVVEGSLQPTLDVLRHTMGDAVAKIAHALLCSREPRRSRELRSSLFYHLWTRRKEATICTSASMSGCETVYIRVLSFPAHGFRLRLEVCRV